MEFVMTILEGRVALCDDHPHRGLSGYRADGLLLLSAAPPRAQHSRGELGQGHHGVSAGAVDLVCIQAQWHLLYPQPHA